MRAVEVVEGGVVEADRLADETLHAVAVHSAELELLVATEPLAERARVGDVRRVRHLIDDEAEGGAVVAAVKGVAAAQSVARGTGLKRKTPCTTSSTRTSFSDSLSAQ